MPRLLRDSPLNSIWEGSGNVAALDVLRATLKEPEGLPAFIAECELARGGDARLDAHLDRLGDQAGTRSSRRAGWSGELALALQAACWCATPRPRWPMRSAPGGSKAAAGCSARCPPAWMPARSSSARSRSRRRPAPAPALGFNVSSVVDATGETGVSPALAPPPGNPRFPLVDGVRAVAVLSIVVYHVSYATGANLDGTIGPLLSRLHVGVAIFFVVSGFLLYRPFLAARRGLGPAVGTGGYLRRRLLRIVPAYWAALTLLAIWPGLPGVFTGDWWIYYGFLQVYSTETYLQGIGPTWSLATEMAFYLVLPFVALLAARVTRGASIGVWVRRELALLGVLYLGAVAFRAWTLRNGAPLDLPPGVLAGTFDWFAVGMGLAVASVALDESGREPRTSLLRGRQSLLAWVAAAGLFALLVWGIGLPNVSAFSPTLPAHPVPVLRRARPDGAGGPARDRAGRARGPVGRGRASAPAVASRGVPGPGVLRRLPVARPDRAGAGQDRRGRRDGDSSCCSATLAVVVPIATASYYVVERPFLRLKYRRPSRRAAAESRGARPSLTD